MNINFKDTTFAMLENHPDQSLIDWKYCSRDHYLKFEELFRKNVLFFEPFLVENFYENSDFQELKGILESKNIKEIAYTKQMNKWEDSVDIPQIFFDKAIKKTQDLLGTKDIELGYYLYAHHQITEEGRKPFLQVHLDWSPGSYMVDLHIGGNRDWGFVAHDKEFITKPNNAIIVQPELDFHYRPDWNSDDPNENYKVLFFHLIRKDHWKNLYGMNFMKDEGFLSFQMQRLYIWEKIYVDHVMKTTGLPSPIFGDDSDLTDEDKRVYNVNKKEVV
jgi:hypothetical protein